MNEMSFAISMPDNTEVADQLQAAVNAIRERSAKKVTILEVGPCEIAIEDGVLKVGCTF